MQVVGPFMGIELMIYMEIFVGLQIGSYICVKRKRKTNLLVVVSRFSTLFKSA